MLARALAAIAGGGGKSLRTAAAFSTATTTKPDIVSALLARLSDPTLLPHTASDIGGCAVPSPSTYAVTDPATGGVLARVARAGAAETAAAIDAAAAAYPAWRDRPAKDRAAILGRWAAGIAHHTADLATIMTAEAGKTIAEARSELASASASVAWAAGEAVRVAGAVLPAADPARRALTLRQPVGVVGAITPWNFPASMVTRKCAPALAVGCAVVLKPSELTPLSALALSELARRAGLPPGVLNLVSGDARAIGGALLASPTVRKLGFTGSTAVGRLLYAGSAATVKRLSLELGGNAACVVCADADVDGAAAAIAASAFRNAGQTCISASRVLVDASVADALGAALAARAGRVRMGPGAQAGISMGPLISQAAVDRVAGHVSDALGAGAASLVSHADALARLGGAGAVTAGGHWSPPTVLVGVPASARLFREETFGPVLGLTPFHSLEEALALANASEAGLASYVFTRDLATAWKAAEGLEVGLVGVNEVGLSADNLPFGGVKGSGLGHENGAEGVAEFLETKTVVMGVGYRRRA